MRSDNSRGFTLVELMIVVAIISILASLAIPAFHRYTKKAKSAEAIGHLNKIWAGAASYYAVDHTDPSGVVLEPQFPGPTAALESTTQCGCQSTSRCAAGATVYVTDPVWIGLSYSISDAHNFMPLYTAAGTGSAASFTADAISDMDCDGILGTWRRIGGAANTDVTGNQTPFVSNEGE